MKAYGEVDIFLTLALVGGEWSAPAALPHLQGRRISQARNQHEQGRKRMLHSNFSLNLHVFFDRIGGEGVLLGNVGRRSPDYTALPSRRHNSNHRCKNVKSYEISAASVTLRTTPTR
jgi:hypothetical protein